MSFSAALFSRTDIRERTGLDDATLDWWSRSGILRPRPGEGGKGKHRRFEQEQVTLAAYMAELFKFGLSSAALVGLAAEFQAALDWFVALGLGDHEIVAAELMSHRIELDKIGYSDVPTDALINALGGKWAAKLPIAPETKVNRLLGECRALNWKQVCEYFAATREDLPHDLLRIVGKIDRVEWQKHWHPYFSLRHVPMAGVYVEHIFLHREPDGKWVTTYSERGETERPVENSFFTLRVADIKRSLWGKAPPPPIIKRYRGVGDGQ